MPRTDGVLETATEVLAKSRIGVLGQRVIDFWSVLAVKKPEVIITCEGGDDASIIAPGVPFISPERLDLRRKLWTNRSFSRLASVARRHLTALSVNPSDPLLLLAYCSTPEWEQLEHETGGAIRVIAQPSALKARLDDKIYARARLAARGLPVPRSIVGLGHGL
jgi:hypothetical protein